MPAASGRTKKLHDNPALPLQRAGKGTALEVLLVVSSAIRACAVLAHRAAAAHA
jgi:hypothetical protein